MLSCEKAKSACSCSATALRQKHQTDTQREEGGSAQAASPAPAGIPERGFQANRHKAEGPKCLPILARRHGQDHPITDWDSACGHGARTGLGGEGQLGCWGLGSPHLCKRPGRSTATLSSQSTVTLSGASFFLPPLLHLCPPTSGIQHLPAPACASGAREGLRGCQGGLKGTSGGVETCSSCSLGHRPWVSSVFPPCAPGSLAPASRRRPHALGRRGLLRVGIGLVA